MHRLAFPHGRVVFVQGLLVARGIPVDQRVRGITRRPCTEKVDEAVIGIKEGKAFLSTSRPDLEFGYKTGQIVIGDAFFRLCLYEIRDIGEHAVDNRDTTVSFVKVPTTLIHIRLPPFTGIGQTNS